MNAWKVIAATLVIFIAGVVTGGLLVSKHFRVARQSAECSTTSRHLSITQIQRRLRANPWLLKNRELLRRMDRELDLTPDQHAHIEAVIAASQERTKALWKPIAPQMNKELQLVHGEIRGLLTPDQQKKFDDFPKPRAGLEKHHGGTNPMLNSATNPVTGILPATNAQPTAP